MSKKSRKHQDGEEQDDSGYGTLLDFYLVGRKSLAEGASPEMMAKCVDTMQDQGIDLRTSVDTYMLKGVLTFMMYLKKNPEDFLLMMGADSDTELLLSLVKFVYSMKNVRDIEEALIISTATVDLLHSEMRLSQEQKNAGSVYIGYGRHEEEADGD